MDQPKRTTAPAVYARTASTPRPLPRNIPQAVADIIRTTLGPKSMLKMILDAQNGITVTNDGHAILREIDVSHPAAKSVIELARTQDEEVGDGTTSVIVLAGEILAGCEPLLERRLHPTVICRGLVSALEDAVRMVEELSFAVDVDDDAQMVSLVMSSIGTKFTSRYGDLMGQLALKAVRAVCVVREDGTREVEVKKYAKVEKIPGGGIEDSRVLAGVMFNKDVVLPSRMRRRIKNPRVLLLDCPLEYKKGESQTNVELTKEEDWAVLLKMEEDWTKEMCECIIKHKPDVVVTEKGLSDLCAHYLCKAGISAIRRARKTDNNRIARATGATIVHRPEEIRDGDIGTKAGLFEVSKIGDEFFTYLVDCDEPKACTIILRGASKDVLNEVERNLTDAIGVARNVMMDPRLVPGGGASEMHVSTLLNAKASSLGGADAWVYRSVARSLEVIPRTLCQNCGANVIRTVTTLRARHAEPDGAGASVGVDGETGKVADMKELGVWEPLVVKAQTFKTAIESATMLVRIDDIVSGLQKKQARGGGGGGPRMETTDGGNVDSEQQLAE